MLRKQNQSAIPVGTQFSADLISLRHFLDAAVKHSGDKEALMDAAWSQPVRKVPVANPPTNRRRSLPLEAAVQYGLLEPGSYVATELAVSLGSQPTDEQLFEAFAHHILLTKGGLRVLQGIEQMTADRLDITGDTLARFLTDQGFAVTEHNTAINTLRQWLAEAGIFPKGRHGNIWQISPGAKERVLGLPEASVGVLAGLTPTQIEFVKALCRVDPQGWCKASEIRDNAEASAALRFGRNSLPNEVLKTLREAHIIRFRTFGTGGGKTSYLKTTRSVFRKEVLMEFVTDAIKTLDPVSSAYYQKRPPDIFAGLDSGDTYTKGQALEAFAVYVMRLLGLRFVAWRKRAAETTGGTEVDALLAGLVGAVPTRWQVQCKNTTAKVDVEDVAKEVGVAALTNATHIVLITTSDFTADAKEYAARIIERTALTIYLLNSQDFERIRLAPGELGSILRDQGAQALLRRKTDSIWW